jgi:hypothetical protein
MKERKDGRIHVETTLKQNTSPTEISALKLIGFAPERWASSLYFIVSLLPRIVQEVTQRRITFCEWKMA